MIDTDTVDERHGALVEVNEPVPQCLLDHQQGVIVHQRVHLVAQHAIGVDTAQVFEALPGALGDARIEVQLGCDLLLVLGGVVGTHLHA
ncbi:hypothetical protein [Micromonospora fulviviridis]|uniref:Uncharacterized protein n=1 Tax=Micromonospora fulviviridis TaxID=47860 RepID=A0ABV2VTH7_9ACTN